jgi:Tol biopolymer transport system component
MPLDATQPPQPLFAAPTPDDHYTQVEWSPDGKYIYFVHYNHNQSGGQLDEVYEIFRMTYPNGTPVKILDALWPRPSSDSSKLVYVTLDPASGKNELFLANTDGSNSQRVLLSGPSTFEIIDAPIFAPDGQSILFSAPVPSQSDQPNWFERLVGIQVAEAHNVPSDWWSVPIAGGTPTQLTNIQTINLFASVSPDKKRIVSVSGEGLFVMDLDGSNLTRLISDPGIHGTVSWIP